MTSKAQMALDQAINEIENEWGYEGIKEEMHEIMKPILKDLDRLEQIDNANPSEALKSLERVYYSSQGYGDSQKHYEIVKQALLKAQKQDKILRIIKEKNVDIKQLKHFIQCYIKEVSLKTYNDYHSKEELTKEEYGLFEEWLDGSINQR